MVREDVAVREPTPRFPIVEDETSSLTKAIGEVVAEYTRPEIVLWLQASYDFRKVEESIVSVMEPEGKETVEVAEREPTVRLPMEEVEMTAEVRRRFVVVALDWMPPQVVEVKGQEKMS